MSGYAYTYLMNGVDAGEQLDRTVQARRASAAALHQRLVDEHLRRAHSGTEAHRGRGRWPGCRAGQRSTSSASPLPRPTTSSSSRRTIAPTRSSRSRWIAPATHAARWRRAAGHDSGDSAARSAAAADDERHGHGDHGAMAAWITPRCARHGASVDHAAMGHGAHESPSSSIMRPPRADRPSTCTSSRPATGLDDPGVGLRDNGRRVLTYADLHTIGGPIDRREPGREIELHLTGHMERFIWSFNGQKFSEAGAAAFQLRRAAAHHAGERLDDDASDPPARHVERDRERARRSSRCASTPSS